MNQEKHEDIAPRFDGCEGTHTEFKQEWCPSLLRAAAAFANTEGGIIYLGIQDSGVIIGVPNEQLDAVQRQCASAIRDTLGFNPKVEVIDFNARKCIAIIVAPLTRLVSYKEGKNSTSNFYLRVGAKTHKMSEDDLSVWGRNRYLIVEQWEKKVKEMVASQTLGGARKTQTLAPPTSELGELPKTGFRLWEKISKLWRRKKKIQEAPPQYLIPEKDVDLLTWVPSVLRPEGFKFLAYVYASPSSFAIGSPEKRKGFQVGFDALYGKFYKVKGRPFFLNPSWYNGNDADEIFLKYGLIELWVESAAGNFYALTPECEKLILKVRRLVQSQTKVEGNIPSFFSQK